MKIVFDWVQLRRQLHIIRGKCITNDKGGKCIPFPTGSILMMYLLNYRSCGDFLQAAPAAEAPTAFFLAFILVNMLAV